ncbi:MAG: hypothetical protein K2L52_01630 [Clostridia bacterium]|nr:hypothetical protein [Clostridia bacterium]
MVESNTSTSVSEEVGLGKTAVTYGDFSSYADHILPETISKSNIARYVPVVNLIQVRLSSLITGILSF